MLLAAEQETADGGLLVRTLVPPPGSEPGDQVFLEGGSPSADTPKQVREGALGARGTAPRVRSAMARTWLGVARG